MGRKKKFVEPRGKANMINVTLYPADEAKMAEFLSRHGTTKREFISRLIRFFGELEPGLQDYVGGTIHPDIQRDLAKVLLNRMAGSSDDRIPPGGDIGKGIREVEGEVGGDGSLSPVIKPNVHPSRGKVGDQPPKQSSPQTAARG